MEKQKLPNATLILVFGILSIVLCCCYGVVGLIFAIIALVMAKKATETYQENPELYDGFNNVKTGKTLAYIGLGLNIIYLIYVIWMYSTLGTEGMMQMQEEMLKKYGM